MTNRTLIYLTVLVLIGMATLFAMNMTSILTGKPEDQTYLKYNHVRGMAISHNQMLYTLNFKQQNDVIEILNRTVRVVGVKPGKRQRPNVDKIIVYQFNDQPDLVITPVAYVDNNLVFSAPAWNQDGFLMEISNGRLHQLLSQTYDP
ncbi:conserved putative membrane protein [Candidatus Protochlamydia naegleriophila]|uniref:Conserved putative membrane protein n=1 Tax=Candidatus Protochlamydia naegleriophila TaxID=389348 RepID=A0A0U5JFF0_9BACT|nr:hypothetical protein [Candidatus Protochlamydia naegleriophila]CUI17119.1 conserved putative membrane protein [Candidatus Protochlamydia naegleriophila]